MFDGQTQFGLGGKKKATKYMTSYFKKKDGGTPRAAATAGPNSNIQTFKHSNI
jgi:hypothetical protein